MKNNIIKFSLLFFLILFITTSCNKDLNYVPESYLSPEQVYSDEAGSIGGITGIYKQYSSLKSGELALIGSIGTDEGRISYFVPTWGGYWLQLSALNSYDNTQLSAQNSVIQYYWQGSYTTVGNANTAIRYLPSANIGEDVKKRLLGEAKFMRALVYFNLVQLFGAVPMPTEKPNAQYDKDGYPRTPESEVYALIKSDLTDAIASLPGKGSAQPGRANKQAAQTLLGKVYLTLKEYPNAESTLKSVMTDGEVGLLPDFANLFKEENENNRESLFEVQFSTELNFTQGLTNVLGSWNMASNKPGGGGHVALPTKYGVSIYSSLDTVRKNASLRHIYYDANGAPGLNWWWQDVGDPHIKKYEQRDGQQAAQSSRNVYVLRYADAVLMYAEVLNELNKTSEALSHFNRIRARAKAPNLEVSLGHNPTQAELRDSLVTERMKELTFEGWRWFDLKRWGLLVQRTKQHNPVAANIVSPKHLLYPIPFQEFQNNRTLKLEDQNPGY